MVVRGVVPDWLSGQAARGRLTATQRLGGLRWDIKQALVAGNCLRVPAIAREQWFDVEEERDP
ncbi:hypothetical protein GCM10010981_43820 [Dyella nitratireducens]|uniref:Uncharacterized protein n=1 Tax=Dyella nitratireducens TaxID=1849580 RepID=A0ABQ1GSW9_9GAMM|nr:hypothetical protein GCM10010981_43820 [Dyella nitratireducens]GLQ42497.1 hypothetical protein GCM10007902_23470 [Dyella nitratireducens]